MAGGVAVPSPSQPNKHRSFTVEFKVGVVEWVEHHSSSVRAAAVHFGLDRKVVRAWIRQKQALREALSSHGAQIKKLHSGRVPTSHDLDQQVLAYVQRAKVNVGEGVTISDKELQQVAKECAQRLGVTGFKASVSWLRGWKGRCQGEGLDGRGRGRRKIDTKENETKEKQRTKNRTENGVEPHTDQSGMNGDLHGGSSSQTTPISSQQLAMLTEEERRGGAKVGGAAANKEPTLSYPDNQLYTDREQGYSYNNHTPKSHDQHMTLHQPSHLATPPHTQGNTPACFQVCLGELLGDMVTLQSREQQDMVTLQSGDQQDMVTLQSGDQQDMVTLQSHDQQDMVTLQSGDQQEIVTLQSRDLPVQLGLGLSEEVGVAEREESQDSALLTSVLTQQALTLSECHTLADHTHSDLEGHASSLLEAEEEQLMSVFNHRSFTDHFPFLPPALFSNWCPPYDPPTQLVADNILQTTPTYDSRSTVRSKIKTTTSPSRPEGGANCQVQTRSMVRAKAAAASVSAGPSIATLPRTMSPSLDTGSPPPTLGGVSLLSSPSGAGGVVSSPPGGGLLANRLSQPKFPDEPAIIFHEIQLGPLHTTPGTIATTPPQLP